MSTSNAIDPVCGMTLSIEQAPFSMELDGTTYHLCSAACLQRFEADGAAYAAVARLDLPGWGRTPHPPAIVEQFRTPAVPESL